MEEYQVSVALYFRLPANRQCELVERALVATGAVVAGTQLRALRAWQIMERQPRLGKVTPAQLNGLLESCRLGLFDTIEARQSRRITSAASWLWLSLDVELFGSPLTQILVYAADASAYQDEEVLPYLAELAGAGLCLEYGTIAYGYASLLYSPGLGIVSDPVLRGPEQQEELNREARFLAEHRDRLFDRVPKAAWGNILGAKHVADLGGEQRIRREAGCYRVERWGEYLYLQLSERPWDVSEDQLRRLSEFLTPIRIPGAPPPFHQGTM